MNNMCYFKQTPVIVIHKSCPLYALSFHCSCGQFVLAVVTLDKGGGLVVWLTGHHSLESAEVDVLQDRMPRVGPWT